MRGHRSSHQEAKACTATRRVFHVAGVQPSHRSGEHGRYQLRVEVGNRTVTIHRLDEGVEGFAVGAAGLRRQVTMGEEGLHRPGHRRDVAERMIRLRIRRRCGWGEVDDVTHGFEYANRR